MPFIYLDLPVLECCGKGKSVGSTAKEFIGLVLGTLYLSILTSLLAPWSCTFRDDKPHVTSDYSKPPLVCYEGAEWTAMAVGLFPTTSNLITSPKKQAVNR